MEGSAHGLGLFVTASGERYVGEWAGDKFHGNGIYKFQGGSAYAVRARAPPPTAVNKRWRLTTCGRALGSLGKWTGMACTPTCRAAS